MADLEISKGAGKEKGDSFWAKLGKAGRELWESTDPNKKPPMGSLNAFISTVKHHSIARTNRYAVHIQPPNSLTQIKQRKDELGNIIDNTSLLSLYCNQASLPGIQYHTSPVRVNNKTIHTPVDKVYDTVNLTFYVDSSMAIKVYFDNWMDSIKLLSNASYGYYSGSTGYTTNIIIDIFSDVALESNDDTDGNIVYSVKLWEAYPVGMNAVTLDYGSTQLMELTVTFQYKEWSSETSPMTKKQTKDIFESLFGDKPWFSATKEAITKLGTVYSTASEYIGRFERLKGMEKGLSTQLKGVKGLFGDKVTRVKDLSKWL